jgi:hypothetical protein
MKEKQKIEEILEHLNHSEKIIVLESLCKKYRRLNSISINEKQMGRKVDNERPDLLSMKGGDLN